VVSGDIFTLKGVCMKKIYISETLKSSFNLYRAHFKKLFIFASLFTVFSIISSFYEFFKNSEEPQWFVVPFMLLSLISLYFMLKAILGIQIYITGAINNKTLSIKDSLGGTHGKLLRYFGNMVATGIFLIPIVLITYYFNTLNNPYYFLISISYNFLIFPLYFLLEPIVALEEKDTFKLKKAIKLIKGNYVRIIIVVFVAQLLWRIPNMIAQAFFKENQFVILLLNAANGIILIFSNAFSSVVKCVLYRQLTAENETKIFE